MEIGFLFTCNPLEQVLVEPVGFVGNVPVPVQFAKRGKEGRVIRAEVALGRRDEQDFVDNKPIAVNGVGIGSVRHLL